MQTKRHNKFLSDEKAIPPVASVLAGFFQLSKKEFRTIRVNEICDMYEQMWYVPGRDCIVDSSFLIVGRDFGIPEIVFVDGTCCWQIKAL